MEKPFDVERLLSLIQEILEKRCLSLLILDAHPIWSCPYWVGAEAEESHECTNDLL
ncbi:hypothetical protein KSC_051230 [Ktedonobacter sp. SOSP1-52]|nr:hypothetical protein KSC_051230 [Ktedonobacter sp. SOSP1-52]